MSDYPVIAVFYSTKELDVKDVESQLFTQEKERFHFFFFHNKNLHFKKDIIFTNTLMQKFNLVPPEFFYNKQKKSVRLHKKITNFNLELFEKEVDAAYEEYVNKINYRIECIFQTFTLFMSLYKDKPLVFVIPTELYEKFSAISNKNNLNFSLINKSNNLVQKFEIFHWIHYYSREELHSESEDTITDKKITGLFLLENDRN